MKRLIAALAFSALYFPLAFAPGELLWFDPQAPVFSYKDGEVGYQYVREIKRDSLIKFSVVVRTPDVVDPVCAGLGGPFTYKATLDDGGTAALAAKPGTLGYWANNPECDELPPGTYYVETVWTIVRPLGDLLPSGEETIGWLLPPKNVIRVSPPFTVPERYTP